MKKQLNKKIAMIPARMGSKRVKNKNLRLIDGKPLISFIIEAVIRSGKFKKEEIFINSEDSIFGNLATQYGIKFYKRDEKYATDDSTNDDFALDFIKNNKCDELYQFLPTSPFIESSDIISFVDKMTSNKLDTLITTTPVKIECVYNGIPLNFKQKEKTPPSQTLVPVNAYACGIMAWSTYKFIENMNRFGAAYHGGDGKTGFFELTGFSTIDIDTEKDFQLAEAVYTHLNKKTKDVAQYYDPETNGKITYEVDVPTILVRDGIDSGSYDLENQTITKVNNIISTHSDSSWMHRVINTESNSCCLISQNPGEGNRRHFHPSWNEWWYIIKGEWDFEINDEVHRVVKDDIVFIPKNTWHKITATGSETAVRLAVSREDVKHGYNVNK